MKSSLFLNIFVNPSEAFKHLKNSPSYAYPVFLLFLAKALAFLVYFYLVDLNWMADQIIQEYSNQIPAEQQGQLVDSLMNVGKGPLAIASIIGALFNIMLGCAFLAGYLLLATTVVGASAEKVTFRQYFSVVSWSAFVLIVSTASTIANALITSAGQIGIEQVNPLALNNMFPQLAESKLFFNFILKIDITILWVFGLVVIGYKTLTSSSIEKSCLVVFFPLGAILLIQSIVKLLD